jgi:hypothetical protein
MSLNDILFSYNTSGATKETAAQDGLTEVGIAASQKMAKTDLPKLLKFAAAFKKAGQKYGLPPALLAAIASRETRGGSQLRANGFGSNGEDFGLMQVNQKSHVLQGSAFSEAHINQATGILKSYYEQVADKHPTWTRPQQLRGAVAAYNFGVSNVRTLEGMDHRTANNDYSSDIWARAQTLAPHFQESPSGVKEDAGPKNGKQTSGVTSASGSQAGQNETLVTELQKLLVKHGYMNARQVQTGPGILGPQTKAALAKFLADKARTPVSNEPVPAPGKSQEPVVNLPTKEVAQLADVPLYNQGDTRWAGEFLQKNLKIGPKGCALTATAMAISKTSSPSTHWSSTSTWMAMVATWTTASYGMWPRGPSGCGPTFLAGASRPSTRSWRRAVRSWWGWTTRVMPATTTG